MNHIVVIANTRKIPFKNSATNIFASSLEVNKFIIKIYKLINKNFNGTINIGGPKVLR